MAITKQKGDIAEIYIAYLLKKEGFNVLLPWGEDHRYALVSEKNGIFKRIQVKYVTPRKGMLEVALRSLNNYQILHYSVKDIDIIAAYEPNNQKVFFVPLKRIKNKSSLKLRLLPSKNKQVKNITMASKFEGNFTELKK